VPDEHGVASGGRLLILGGSAKGAVRVRVRVRVRARVRVRFRVS